MVTMQFPEMQFWKGQYNDKQVTFQRFNAKASEVHSWVFCGLPCIILEETSDV